jgi:hypothetical protein
MVAVTMKLASILVGGVLLLAGCSDDDPAVTPIPLPECPREGYDVCDIRTGSCQAQLRSLAACVYGNDDPPEVPVHVVSEAQFRASLEEGASQEGKGRTPADEQATAAMERALVDLKLIQPGALSDETRIDDIVRLFVGVYLDAEQGIVVVDRGTSLSSVDSDMLLLHEYIHALQDVDYELDDWHEKQGQTSDAVLAARSVTEGEATFYQMRAGAAMLGYDSSNIDFESTFRNLRRDLSDSAREDASPFIASSATFPYGYGAELANRAYAKSGQGFEAELFENVPPTTREVMRLALYPDDPSYTEREPLEHEAPTPSGSFALLDEDVLGLWNTRLVLPKEVDTHPDPYWLGVFSDHLWVYADDSGNTAWLWEVQTNDPDAMSTILSDLREALPGVTIETAFGRLYFAGGSDGVPDFLSEAGQAFIEAGNPDP